MLRKKFKWIHFFQIIFVVFICVFMGYLIRSCINDQTRNEFVVMSTTDMHGRIWDSDVQTGDSISDNMLAASSIIKETKNRFDDRTILFDNGDLFQESLIESLGLTKPDKGAAKDINPCTIALDELRYDGFTLGNHEFDYKYDLMAKNYEYIKQNTSLVAANVYEKGTNNRIFKPYITKTVKVSDNYFKIGLIGLENPECYLWNSSSFSDYIELHAVENTNANLAYEIARVQEEMRKADERCDFVIVSMYNGFFEENEMKNVVFNQETEDMLQQKMKEPLRLGKNTEAQAYRTIKETTGIDMFITGHDKSEIYSNKTFSNADGSKDVLVVNGGSTSVTKSVFKAQYSKNEHRYDISLRYSENIKLANYSPDEVLRSRIEPYVKHEIESYAQTPGELSGEFMKIDNKDSYYRQQTDEIDLINRAQMWAGKRTFELSEKSVDQVNEKLRINNGENTYLQFHESKIEPDLSIATIPDVDKIKPLTPGKFLYKDATELYSADDYLCAVAITGKEIKDMLEFNCAYKYFVETDQNGNTSVKVNGDTRTVVIPYGINVLYDMNRPMGDRVLIQGFSNGKSFDMNGMYCMMVNSYILENMSSAMTQNLTRSRTIIDQELNHSGTYIRHIIDLYVTKKTTDYGAVYPSHDAKKDNEVASFWGFAL